jgi:hypothetical protein
MRRRGPHETWSAEPHDEYILVLEDIDELFTAMVAAASINPTFLGERHRLKPTLREWYAKDNVHPMAGVFRTDPAENGVGRLWHRHYRRSSATPSLPFVLPHTCNRERRGQRDSSVRS